MNRYLVGHDSGVTDTLIVPVSRRSRDLRLIGLLILLLTGCSSASTPVASTLPLSPQIVVTRTPLQQSTACSHTFITHPLDHTTFTHTKIPTLYESNGSGIGLNDLDNDGDLDIVLANLRDPNTILWNQGGLHFRSQRLGHGDSRNVSLVDVDGDGWLDIVFTQRLEKPTYWRNLGRDPAQSDGARFAEGTLPGVNNPFYSLAWADLDQDGDLDLVAGSYDTELRKEQGAIFDYRGGGVGVFLYSNQGDHFSEQRLAKEADALEIALPDLNQDGQPDIWVGNDFNRPDFVWLQQGDRWTASQPFQRTSESTMSIDLGDIDNDGQAELFATDMKPYQEDVKTLAEWLPMMDKMTHPKTSGDPQRNENVLQVRDANGRLRNQAYTRALDATGWSWSSKFGDLDNDGFLDIYAVNGMIADSLFAHLPGSELVEENQALRNDGHGYFTHAPEWGLGSTASGRGMSMGDLDNDGDLEIVVNNLQSPAQLFENQLCHSLSDTSDNLSDNFTWATSVEVALHWPASKNPFAIGALLILHTSTGSYLRDVRVNSGYLSSDPTRIHFGLPHGTTVQSFAIDWPDGARSVVDGDIVDGSMSGMLVTVTRR